MIPVTAIFIAILLVLQTALSFHVGVNRAKRKIEFGDGGDTAMHRSIRAHGNVIEYVPIALLAMTAAEVSGIPVAYLWATGGILVVARRLHAGFMLGFIGTIGRVSGAALTSLVSLALAATLLASAAGLFG